MSASDPKQTSAGSFAGYRLQSLLGGLVRVDACLGTPKHRDYFLLSDGDMEALPCPILPQVERPAEEALAMP
jgi:hypothetical protein